MTNREKLHNMAIYDLLVQMSYFDCPIAAIEDDDVITANHCREHDHNCEECIAAWLNEEVHHERLS